MANKTDTLKQVNEAVNRRAILVHRVAMAQKVISYLAFTWSTAVLLGGYVTSLEKKDFGCLALISLAEATRIFDDTVDEKLGLSVISFMRTSAQMAVDITKDQSSTPANSNENTGALYVFRRKLLAVLFTGILMAPVVAAIFCILFLMEVSSFLFVALPSWRILQHDYGVIVGDSSKATLVPALDIFYSLVLVQGGLSFFLFIIRLTQKKLMDRFYALCEFPEGWGRYAFAKYFEYTMEKSKKDPTSVEAASLSSYACEMLGSESTDEVIIGISVLGTLAKQRTRPDPPVIAPLLHPLLLSREKIQKLILTLGMYSGFSFSDLVEIREHSARIVADLAGLIPLVQFPGAARCISTLLEAPKDGGCNNELVVQGLAILASLAHDPDNCREICSTPGLLPKIMAPICSSELIRDPRILRSPAVSGTIQVLFILNSCAPGNVGRGLRSEISRNRQAVTNLESIALDQDNKYGDELRILATQFLLQLYRGKSLNPNPVIMSNFTKWLLQIFPGMEGEAAAADEVNQLNTMAGRALAVLNLNTMEEEAYSDSFNSLHGAYDPKNKIYVRSYACKILENLCEVTALGDEFPKEVLRKVLSEILRVSKGEQQTISSTLRDDKGKRNPKDKLDIMKQKYRNYMVRVLKKQSHEALLSLTLKLHNLVRVDTFALVAQQVAPGEGAIVESLKTIIEKNSEASMYSLSIVKLCYQIAISMLQRNQYTAQFKDSGFLETVSNATRIMSETESCMLISYSTDIEKATTLRPFLFELENKLKQELDRAG